MSTIIVAALLAAFIAIIVLLFVQIEKHKKQRHMNQFLTRFRDLGALNNLTFSSQEILQDAAIGLDGIHRKILVLTGETEKTFSNHLLCLNDIKSCSVKKQYGTIRAAGLKKYELEHYLEKIALRFELKNGCEPVEVNFFHHTSGNVYQIKELEDKAKHWETILSKMLPSSLKKAA